MPEARRGAGSGLLDQLPTDRLVEQGQQLVGLLAQRAIDRAVESVEDLAERLIEHACYGGPGLISAITGRGAGTADTAGTEARPPLRTTVKAGVTGVSESVRQAVSGVAGLRRSGRTTRTRTIAEHVDVGVPVRLAYDQWTRFQDFSQFMKNVKAVEKTSAELSHWKVQFFWSPRDWESRIVEQVPDERIIWRSVGTKGYVDGAVSFHALAPNMTRILLALEYHPDGLAERTGSFWGAHNRRVRLEIKQFRHHLMTQVVLDPNSVHGWRGEIRDGRLVRTHEEALAQEREENEDRAEAPDAPAEDDDHGDHGDHEDAPGNNGSRDEPAEEVEDDNPDDPDSADDDHDNADEYDEPDDYDDPDGAYDDSDDLYDDDPVREPVRSRTR
ncbi:MAG TPA: SRPBCC family protein [Pseudonocardiaceae bacterium]|nr:SRPBCC family protein [Pseudonocardiaceae bacterium]